MITLSNTKACIKCFVQKPATIEFYHANNKSPDGLRHHCRDCKTAYDRERYLANRKSILERVSKWNAEHKKDKQLYDQAYRAKNFYRIAEQKRKNAAIYKALYPEKVARKALLQTHKRRNAVTYVVTESDLTRLANKYDNKCFYCRCVFTETNWLEFDHIIPISRGGNNSIGNFVPACMKCNRTKSHRLVMEWRINKVVPRVYSADNV